MNKLTVTFNNYKSYNFITENTNIQENDFVLVMSPVSDSGFGVARVKEVEENTQDTYHKPIVSKLNMIGDIAQEVYENLMFYDVNNILLKNENLFLMYNNRKEIAAQKILSHLIDNICEYKIIKKYHVFDNFYKLELSDKISDNCIEIDYLTHKVYVNIKKYNYEFEPATWKEFKFEEIDYNLPKEFIVSEIDDFEDALSESIDIIKNTLSENDLRYRVTYSNEDDMLDEYVFDFKSYNGDGDFDFEQMLEHYNIFPLKTKKFICDNVESIYDSVVKPYTIDLILPIQIEAPNKYKELESYLNKKYVKIAEVEITALEKYPDIYDRDEEEFDYDTKTIIEFNPKYK